MSSSIIKIKPVITKADRKIFIKLIWDIYKDDPRWVPPIIMERMAAIDPNKNPYFEHAKVKLWIAYKDGNPVGRISAQIDELVSINHRINTGQYGYLDCINNKE
ncbi:MAG: hypothetical protein QNL35_04795, partial [Emcibacteraceae bacterium]